MGSQRVESTSGLDQASNAPHFQAVHHIGVTVADLDRSLAFWEGLLGRRARSRHVGDRPYLGRVVGYPGIRIEFALLDLPGGVTLELLQYLDRDDGPNPPDTARPGNVHICLQIDDIDTLWSRAVALGAQPRSDQPIEIPTGANAGARVAYLRDPAGLTFELVEPARKTSPATA